MDLKAILCINEIIGIAEDIIFLDQFTSWIFDLATL
jgi:hypothetical protein